MATRCLLLHGANLNMLGKRDPELYGSLALNELVSLTKQKAYEFDMEIHHFQSNHEGDLVDFIQTNSAIADGIIINAGAFTHYSYALHDALLDSNIPVIEVHLSDIMQRESWRQHSVIRPVSIWHVYGKQEKGYFEALEVMANYLKDITGKNVKIY